MKRRKKMWIVAIIVSLVAVVAVVVWQNEWIYRDVITGESKTPKEILGGLLLGTPTEIKKGFSDELREELESHYHIRVPDDAVFIKGYNTNAFRDPSVFVVFTCSVTREMRQSRDPYIFAALGLEDTNWTRPGDAEPFSDEWMNAMGGPWEKKIEHKTVAYTYVYYSLCGDTLTVFVNGHHPRTHFK